jgi:DegV family protein with EDD domain
MANYKIITDVTCDLPVDIIKKHDLVIMPMKYSIGGVNYTNYEDFREQSLSDFYKGMRNGLNTHTVQLNSEIYMEVYRKYLDDGYDILGIVFSSGLSGSYNSARLAVEELKEQYPDRNIKIVDTLAASTGEGLIALKACNNQENGMDIEQNYNDIEMFKLSVAHWFTVDNLEYLRRGGRVSNTAAFAGKLLNIKPVLHVDNEGHLIPIYKKIGRKTSIREIAKQYSETVDKSYDTVVITHADCIDDAMYLKSLIEEINKPNEIIISNIGTVIGSHSGPGTLALFFKASHR